MAIAEQTLGEIRSRLDLVAFIDAQVPLKRAGANYSALCPFHKEKTPSFSVSPQKQIFYCFGCQAGGDVFKFVMLRENVDFLTAVRMLAERAGVSLEGQGREPSGAARSEKELLYKLHEQVCAFYQLQLAKSAQAEVARAYLAKRQLSAQSIDLFRIGYAPDSWDATLTWAQGKKYSPILLERAGLAIRREGASGLYDRFRGRLMFPICNEEGRVVGFSGRVLTEEAKAAKYVNSPETPIFQKGKILFGLDKTKRALLDEKFAIVCEGQIDLIACHQQGLRNLVAPQGTAFTADHGRLLKRFVDEVVLCFDADSAGQNAAVRSMDALLESGLVVRVVTLPAGHDPDTLVRQEGIGHLRQLVKTAPGYFEFRLNALCQQYDSQSDSGKSRIVHALVEALGKLTDAVLRDRVLKLAAHRLDVREETLREVLQKFLHRRARGVFRTSSVPSPSVPFARKIILTPEKELLHLLLADESGRARSVATVLLEQDALPDNEEGQLIRVILNEGVATPVNNTQSSLVTELLMTPLRCPDPEVATQAVVRALHIRQVEQELRSPHATSQERVRLQRLLLDLKQQV